MAMEWFWRLVCSPDCSDQCQVNCPGCRVMADEWEQQGHTTPVTGGAAPPPGRLRDFRHAITCFAGSAAGRVLARLNPLRDASSAPAGGCCGTSSTQSQAASAGGCCAPSGSESQAAAAATSCCAPSGGASQAAPAATSCCAPSGSESQAASSASSCCAPSGSESQAAPAATSCCGGDSAPTAAGGLQVATDAGISLTGAGKDDPVRGAVRGYYDQQARVVDRDGPGTSLQDGIDAISTYDANELDHLPMEVVKASLGCGNPFARAALAPGEVVLDLGSGAGMDALVAAQRVGPDGHVFGLDMSDEMIALAQRNAAEAGVTNIAFLKGDLESVPLPRESVDVIISNCVVNLVPDKVKAMREAYRVLRPDGRLSVSDISTREPVPEHFQKDLEAWAACAGGALTTEQYRAALVEAGFVDIEIERLKEFTVTDVELAGLMPMLERSGLIDALDVGFASTSIYGRKLVRSSGMASNGRQLKEVHR